MNFFERQAQTRAQSRRMVALFLLSVIAIVVAIDGAVLAGLLVAGGQPAGSAGELIAQYAGALGGATLVTVLIIAAASLYKMSALRSGGSAVAEGLGATRIPSTGADAAHRRLRNVVEEIAIASGVPVTSCKA
jgi:hypothetical protein